MNIANVSSVTAGYIPQAQEGATDSARDLQALGKALEAGNVANAQHALTTLQQDLQLSSPSVQRGQPFGRNSQLGKDFHALQNALGSGDLSSARLSFASLKQDIQGTRPNSHASYLSEGHGKKVLPSLHATPGSSSLNVTA